MKSERFKLVCLGNRGGMFYCKDTQTGSRTSLKTFDRKEAERLIFHKNEANGQPHINRRIGLAYLAAADPELVRRTWRAVMDDILKDKHGPTLVRTERAMRDDAFKLIEGKLLVETRAEDLLEVLRAGGTCTNVFLRRLQNHALDLGWLPVAALPKKLFPKVKHQQKRAITAAEHERILAREGNPERRDYYDLCWHLGGSQTDVATLHAEDIDYQARSYCYGRHKTGSLGGTRLGPKAWELILRRPRTGPLFPYLNTVREADRATEFHQRCVGLSIQRDVADKATVPIYYESRISKLSLNAAELPKLDAEFESSQGGPRGLGARRSRRRGGGSPPVERGDQADGVGRQRPGCARGARHPAGGAGAARLGGELLAQGQADVFDEQRRLALKLASSSQRTGGHHRQPDVNLPNLCGF